MNTTRNHPQQKPDTARSPEARLAFTKMHGLGNDFVMLKAADIPQGVKLGKLAVHLCDRHFGIGADGMILEGPPSDPARFDIEFIYYNNDGGRAEMCGNGIRCFALFLRDEGLIDKDVFTAETPAGPIQPAINPDRTVTVDMGPPILTPEKIPFNPSGLVPNTGEPTAASNNAPLANIPLTVLETRVPVTPVSMGNPHCLVFQDDLVQEDLPAPLDPAKFGPPLETHPAFPAKTNVEFIKVRDKKTVDVIVWERGCGFTLACGTGACATAVGAHLLGKTGTEVTVNLPGGPLQIRWDKVGSNHVFMTGPAAYAFRGSIPIDWRQFE